MKRPWSRSFLSARNDVVSRVGFDLALRIVSGIAATFSRRRRSQLPATFMIGKKKCFFEFYDVFKRLELIECIYQILKFRKFCVWFSDMIEW